MSLPNGLLGRTGNSLAGMVLVGADGFNVNATGASYTASYTGTPIIGTILQQLSLDLTNSYQPTQAWSATYNAAAQFASVTIKPVSANSQIQVLSNIMATSTNGGLSLGVWVNGTGNPMGAVPVLKGLNNQIYSNLRGFWGRTNSSTSSLVINFCGFFTPSSSNANNRILGSSDSLSYSGSLCSCVVIREVQL